VPAKAEIVEIITYSYDLARWMVTQARQGELLLLQVNVANKGWQSAPLWCEILDLTLTMPFMPKRTAVQPISPQQTIGFPIDFQMPQRSLNLELRVGHLEQQVQILDQTRKFTLKLKPKPPKPPAWLGYIALAGLGLTGLGLIIYKLKKPKP